MSRLGDTFVSLRSWRIQDSKNADHYPVKLVDAWPETLKGSSDWVVKSRTPTSLKSPWWGTYFTKQELRNSTFQAMNEFSLLLTHVLRHGNMIENYVFMALISKSRIVDWKERLKKKHPVYGLGIIKFAWKVEIRLWPIHVHDYSKAICMFSTPPKIELHSSWRDKKGGSKL